MASALAECFNAFGIRVIPMASATGVARTNGQLEIKLSNGNNLRGQKILVTVGRSPHTEGLGLEEAGVKFDSAGWVRVDNNYATSAPGVLAAGPRVTAPHTEL
jgi:pyruvate/2-oxoglutarate dehydrogenase complex dihydrolipoamide dehydrogenase (E3) component